MLEVVTPNEKPEYRKFSDDGFDAEASVDLHPSDEGRDENDRTTRAALELSYRFASGSVRVHASVHFAANPGSSRATTTVPVGESVVARNQPVAISRLSQFGLKSVELRLVSARPPDPTLLPVSNKTSSLIVQNVDEDRNYYNLTVRNVSGVAVEGVIASVVGASGAVDMHRQFPMSGVFLVPGGVREVSISKEDNPSDSQQLLIEAVLFADGTYEGDEKGAAILEATYVGRQRQEQRIADSIEKELRNAETEDEAKIMMMSSRVSSLPEGAELSLVGTVLARIPNLTDDEKQLIPDNVRDGLRMGKNIFLDNLKLYRFERQKACVPLISPKDWWDKTNGQRDSLVTGPKGN